MFLKKASWVGLQEGEDPRYVKVIATCKHYFAYDVDAGSVDGKNYDRHSFNAVVTKADLAEYYLPAWEACATEAKAGSIMCRSASTVLRPSCFPPWHHRAVSDVPRGKRPQLQRSERHSELRKLGLPERPAP